MRTEEQMFALILEIAQRDDRIRAVYLNGSRANPAAPRDLLQDYDVVFVVTDIQPFLQDKAWLSVFGEMAILQEPERSTLFPPCRTPGESYAYLMQFADGARIDLSIEIPKVTAESYTSDSLTLPLLDKDGILPPLPPPSDVDYHIQRPTQEQYRDCCNEFWWITLYVAKALYRGELLYALEHLNAYLRPMLLLMLSWQVGIDVGFDRSVGKCHKYLPQLLPPQDAAALLRTWPTADRPTIEASMMHCMELFRRSAAAVAAGMGFAYNRQEEDGASACLQWMLELDSPAFSTDRPIPRAGKVMLLCGRICSGKSSYAAMLASGNRAVVLNADEWMLSLFPQQLGEEHPRILGRVRELLFDHAARIAAAGTDVVLDLGFWTARERAQAREYFVQRNIPTELHYIDTEKELWLRMVQRRNELVTQDPAKGYYIDENMARLFWDAFEEPSAEECFCKAGIIGMDDGPTALFLGEN